MDRYSGRAWRAVACRRCWACGSSRGPTSTGSAASPLGKAAGDEGALDSCGQATKGVWGMSWRQEALKGVEVCDMPGGVDKRAVIPGFPNPRVLNT
jgi:hypothetical protein